MTKKKTKTNFLPPKVYETLRWIICIVLPAIATLIAGLDKAWGWGLPINAILGTFSLIETFLGALFLGSKIVTDSGNK